MITIFKNKLTTKIPIETFDSWTQFNGWEKGSRGNVTDENGVKYKDMSIDKQQEVDIEIDNSIMASKLSYPIWIILKNNGDVLSVLDGNHRIAKAKMLGKKYVLAKILSREEVIKHFS